MGSYSFNCALTNTAIAGGDDVFFLYLQKELQPYDLLQSFKRGMPHLGWGEYSSYGDAEGDKPPYTGFYVMFNGEMVRSITKNNREIKEIMSIQKCKEDQAIAVFLVRLMYRCRISLYGARPLLGRQDMEIEEVAEQLAVMTQKAMVLENQLKELCEDERFKFHQKVSSHLWSMTARLKEYIKLYYGSQS